MSGTPYCAFSYEAKAEICVDCSQGERSNTEWWLQGGFVIGSNDQKSNYQLTDRERALFVRYSALSLPRHTSYPAANYWRDCLAEEDYKSWLLEEISPLGPQRLGLYVHIPFCRSLCHYCGCTGEVITDGKRSIYDPSGEYLKALARERHSYANLGPGITSDILVDKIHLGGGTPTFLNPDQLLKLWDALGVSFHRHSHHQWEIDPAAELAAEIDPRVTSRQHLEVLWEIGFRRLSFGIQDFNREVQRKINRIQPLEMVQSCVEEARSVGFQQINFDLIYGLPLQTVQTIEETLATVVSLKPSRIAFYRLAVMPEIFKWQKSFTRQDLPAGFETLDMMLMAVQVFRKFNYQFIGFDHFALPDDPLWADYLSRRLVRNFQGMTTGGSSLTIGMGPSAISSGQGFYAQNFRTRAAWMRALELTRPTARGIKLSPEEQKRRALILDLYCYGEINRGDFQLSHIERRRLNTLCDEGLLIADSQKYRTTFLGQLLTRVIGSALDPYLPGEAWSEGLRPGLSSAAG